MCCFTRPVFSVADTRIFARLTGSGRQLLIYEMSYAAAEDLAMVLPLPVASRDEETAVRFIDLSAKPKFFDGLANLVWLWEEDIGGRGNTLSSRSEPVGPPLKVHAVGAFDASFVPSLADFDRLDARFRLQDDVWAKLPQYGEYGFAVFKLRETGNGLKGVHPMAFEFSTRLTDTLFVPTVHVHDGQVHPQAWFDHLVYVQGNVNPAFLGGHYHRGGHEKLYLDGTRISAAGGNIPDKGLEVRRIDGWKLEQLSGPKENRLGVVRWAESHALPVGEEVVRRWMELASVDRTIKTRYVSWKAHESAVYSKLLPGCFELDAETNLPIIERGFPVIKVETKEFERRYAELLPLDQELWGNPLIGYAPLLDLESPLYAVGMSGLLPNADTLMGVG